MGTTPNDKAAPSRSKPRPEGGMWAYVGPASKTKLADRLRKVQERRKQRLAKTGAATVQVANAVEHLEQLRTMKSVAFDVMMEYYPDLKNKPDLHGAVMGLATLLKRAGTETVMEWLSYAIARGVTADGIVRYCWGCYRNRQN